MGRAFEVRKASMMKTGIQKSKLYSRFGKEIYMAAKSGGPDPDSNITLKRIIEKAKGKQVPNDIIKRNIEKAKGGQGEDYSSVMYEGFGPGGSTIIVDCLTDNVNRTVSEVRNCFTKTDSKMGVSGCVVHMYNQLSIVSFEGMNEEEVLEILLMNDCNVEDIEDEDGIITVYAPANEHYKVKEALTNEKDDIKFVVDEISWIPNDYITIDGEELVRFEKFMTMIEECEDVQDVYHNIKLK